MIRRLDRSTDSAYGYAVSGTFTPADLETITADLAGRSHGDQVRDVLLLFPGGMPDAELALLDTLRAAPRVQESLRRVAIVTDSAIVEWASRLDAALSSVEQRTFGPARTDAAWAWLAEV